MKASISTHIRRKDFRSQRPLVLLFWGALALGLVHHLELAIPLSTGPWSPNADLASGLGDLLGGAAIVLAVVAAAAALVRAVIEDGPADSGRFLATRPVGWRDVVLGKLGFALLHLAAPAALATAVYLLASGMGWSDVLLGVGQTALFAGGFLLACGAFALLWPGGHRALAGLAAAVAAGFAMLELLPAIGWRSGAQMPGSVPALLQAAVVAALVMGGAAIAAARRSARDAPRFAAAVAGAALLVGIHAVTPWRSLPLRAAEGSTAARSGATSDPSVHGRLGRMRSQGGDQLFIACRPDAPADPDKGFWTLDVGEVRLSDRGRLFRDPWAADAEATIVRRPFGRGLTPSLNRAVRAHLGEAPLWLTDAVPSAAESTSLSIPLPAPERSTDGSGEGIRLHVAVATHLWRDEVVADLPLREGASAVRGPGDRWTIAAAGRDESGEVLHVGLIRRQREFWLSTDPSRRNSRDGIVPGSRFTYVLHDPARRLAVPVRQFSSIRESRGTAAGLARHALILRPYFNQLPSAWREVAPSDLRLIIVERRHVRTRACGWDSLPFVAGDLPPIHAGTVDPVDETLDRGAFAAWFDALGRPADDAPAREVAAHLVRVLEQAARCRFSFDASHPAAADLARFVPSHFGLFLEAVRSVPDGQHHPRQLLIAAIVLGAAESQQEAVLSALPSTPRLMEVVLARGWTPGVVPRLPQLAEVFGHDAGLLARIEAAESGNGAPLVERFIESPDRHVYSALRGAPGLAPGQLDALVNKAWSDAPPAFLEHGWPTPALETAVRHGVPEALRTFHHAIGALHAPADPGGGVANGGQLAHLLTELVDTSVLSEQERWDTRKLLEWFLSTRPEDFRFDPVVLRWTTIPARGIAAIPAAAGGPGSISPTKQ